jgi:hypothetical protein
VSSKGTAEDNTQDPREYRAIRILLWRVNREKLGFPKANYCLPSACDCEVMGARPSRAHGFRRGSLFKTMGS